MKMNRKKILAVLLVIILGGSLCFLLSSGENPVAGKIINYIKYPYPQALSGNNTTANLTSGDNPAMGGIISYINYPYPQALSMNNTTENPAPAPTFQDITADSPAAGENAVIDRNLSLDEEPPADENQLLLELLLEMEEEGTLDKSLLMMFLGIDEGNLSVAAENVTPEPEPTPDPDAWKMFTTTKWRFSIPYPPSWVVKEGKSSNPAVTFTAPAETECSAETTECYQYVASLAITVDQNPSTLILEDYFNRKVATLQKSQGITATSKSAPTTISENKAYWIEYYSRDERGNPSKWYMQYFTALDKKVYILTYSGPYSTAENVYTYYKPDAQKMIDEFVVDREVKIA